MLGMVTLISPLPILDINFMNFNTGGSVTTCDIASYSGSIPMDDVKYKLINDRIPSKAFKFPGKKYKDRKRKDGSYIRHRNHDWLIEFPFLSYSKAEDGLYCLSYVFFRTGNDRLHANLLIQSPYQNWKNARTDIIKHSTLQYHRTSETMRFAFMQTWQGSQDCLSMQIREQVAANRTFLKSIISCIEFCGRQGIALRRHRDDATSTGILNEGNFKALIHFRIESGDTELDNHLKTCSSRSTCI